MADFTRGLDRCVPFSGRNGRRSRALFAAAAVPWLGLTALLSVAQPANAIVYRNDETDATAAAISNQNQFSGTGIVGGQAGSGTGNLILQDWVLTAEHVTQKNGDATDPASFTINGVTYGGVAYNDPNSDVSLIHLTGPSLPSLSSAAPIPINTFGNDTGRIAWLVGYGGHGPVSQSANGGANLNYDFTRHAGTNVIREYSNPFLYFNNSNTDPTSTLYEASTAPGDSGGPMFEQINNVWYVVGEVNGANSNGFVHSPTNPNKNFILSTIRNVKNDQSFNFTTPAAPTSLTWDADITTDGVNDGAGIWDIQRTTFLGGATGFNYQWENGMNNDVVFGGNNGAAGVVTITATNLPSGTKIDGTAGPSVIATGVTAHHLTFNTAGSGTYKIASSGNAPLTLVATAAGDPILTANANAEISAPITGTTATITKAGNATLLLSGTNSYSGNTLVTAGTLQAQFTASLPNYSTSAKISVSTGATLAVNAGGATEWTATQINTLRNTAGFASGSAIGIDTTNGAFTYDQTLGGNIGFTKLGTNTLTDTVANTYAGATTVSGGVLKMSTTAGLPASSAVTVTSGGTLELDGYVTSGTQTFANGLNLTGSGAAGARGALTFNHGNIYTVNLTGGITLGGNTTIGSYAVSNTINFNAAIGGTGNLGFNDEGGSLNNHTFTANFNVKNTYAGNTTFSSGNGNQAFFKIGLDNALPTGTLLTLAPNAGRLTFDLNGHDQTVAGLTLNNSSRLSFDLGTNSDLLTTAALTLGSGVNVNVLAVTGFGVGTYALIDYTGTLTNGALLSTWTTSGLAVNYTGLFTLGTDITTSKPSVLLTVVPEPALVGVMAVGAIGLLRRRQKNS